MAIKVISGRTVRELVSIDDLVAPMRDALVGFSTGRAFQHPRITVSPNESDAVLIMPAADAASLGIKIITMYPRAGERGLPSIQGLIVLVDNVFGRPLSIVDGAAVTELRTAAVSALATDALARPDARTLAIVGAGVQGRAHLAALGPLRDWTSIRIHSRTKESAESMVAWARSEGLPAELAAPAGADVICTATSACTPLFPAEDVAASGVHITAVGAFGPTCRELPSELVARSTLFADSREAIHREAGDILVPLSENRLPDPPAITELGEVLAGIRPGRTDPTETTLFKSLGLPIEDTIACDLIYRRALETGAGQDIELD